MLAYHLKIIDEDGLSDYFAPNLTTANNAKRHFEAGEEVSSVTIEQVEIPTTKEELLSFINRLKGALNT